MQNVLVNHHLFCSTVGEPQCVARRLDARYDWLPSPDTLATFGHLLVVYVGEACSPNTFKKEVAGRLALVSNETGNCSYFTKVRLINVYAARQGAIGTRFSCLL